MAEVPFDTLKLARRLEAAGFPTQQAGDMAEAIAEALSQLATKADLAALQAPQGRISPHCRRNLRRCERN
jgi:hypothetical protein